MYDQKIYDEWAYQSKKQWHDGIKSLKDAIIGTSEDGNQIHFSYDPFDIPSTPIGTVIKAKEDGYADVLLYIPNNIESPTPTPVSNKGPKLLGYRKLDLGDDNDNDTSQQRSD